VAKKGRKLTPKRREKKKKNVKIKAKQDRLQFVWGLKEKKKKPSFGERWEMKQKKRCKERKSRGEERKQGK